MEMAVDPPLRGSRIPLPVPNRRVMKYGEISAAIVDNKGRARRNMDIFPALLNWLPGMLLLINAVPMSFIVGLNAALPLFMMSLLFLPPVEEFIHAKTSICINPKTKMVLSFFLYVPHFYFVLSYIE
jgi:hypothetical protein